MGALWQVVKISHILSFITALHRPLVSVQEDEDTGSKAVVVSYEPPLDSFGEEQCEVIFMIDRSGSMDKFNRLETSPFFFFRRSLSSCFQELSLPHFFIDIFLI